MIRDRFMGNIVGFLTCVCFKWRSTVLCFQWVFPRHPSIANGTLLVSNLLAWAFALLIWRESLIDAQFVTALSAFRQRFILSSAFRCGWLVYSALSKSGVICCYFRSRFPALIGAMGILAACRATVGQVFHARFCGFVDGWLILYALKTATDSTFTFVTEYAMQIGSVLQVILLSLALGVQAREVFEQRDRLDERGT